MGVVGTAEGVTMTTNDNELADFPRLTERYQRELLAHCYRMSGSVHEAEDLVQETFLRAWRASADFEGRSSVRTWLYRIATNVCLTNLEGRPRRPLPSGIGTADQPAGDALEQDHEITWLEPVPDAAVTVAERDSIRLAFVAALQHLPARQRAVLILRDVLRWSAAEVAEALDTTVAAVNSALQRAHAPMKDRALTEDTVADELTTAQRQLLERYVEAFWRKDVDTIVSMLTAEAVWEMPPFTSWFKGRANIAWLIGNECPGGSEDMPMIETRANGQPAFGLYMRTPEGGFVPFQLQVLQWHGDPEDPEVSQVDAFFDTRLFEKFGLPMSLPADHRPAGAVTALLDEGVELLERSLAYTRVALAAVRPTALTRRTPCARWDLGALLAHMDDALDAFLEAAGGTVAASPTPRATDTGPGTVPSLQRKACALLGTWSSARPSRGPVVVGGAPVEPGLLVAAAALEVTVHGWDVATALGLDKALLPLARATADPQHFADPLPVPEGAGDGVRLLAALGRAG
jgi:RNA polymerase sigma-70 factor, ECF subfamily